MSDTVFNPRFVKSVTLSNDQRTCAITIKGIKPVSFSNNDRNIGDYDECVTIYRHFKSLTASPKQAAIHPEQEVIPVRLEAIPLRVEIISHKITSPEY